MAKIQSRVVDILSADNSELPDCCGIRVLHYLYTDSLKLVSTKVYNKLIDEGKDVDKYISKRDLIEEDDEFYFSSATIATTISSQKGPIKVLKRLGFKPLKKFRNPSTNRLITLWFRSPGK